VGPAIGMIAGALALPRLRRATSSSGATTAPSAGPVDVPQTPVAAREDDDGGLAPSSVSRRLAQVGSVTDWAPLVGALPASPDTGPAPVLFGVTGHWK
jgi:hypothetical protein